MSCGFTEINAVLFNEIYVRYSAVCNAVFAKFACARNEVVGGVGGYLHTFLISTRHGVSGYLYSPATLPPAKEPTVHINPLNTKRRLL